MVIYKSTVIGKILRDIIEKKKLSYRKVAEDLGIDHASLYRSLMEGANPEWKTIEELLDYLGYDFRLVKRRDVKRIMTSTSKDSWGPINNKIHENLQKLFKNRRGEILTSGEVKKVYEKEFKNPDVGWVQASDHIINVAHKKDWYCSCVGTDKAIFERIKRGQYKVR